MSQTTEKIGQDKPEKKTMSKSITSICSRTSIPIHYVIEHVLNVKNDNSLVLDDSSRRHLLASTNGDTSVSSSISSSSSSPPLSSSLSSSSAPSQSNSLSNLSLALSPVKDEQKDGDSKGSEMNDEGHESYAIIKVDTLYANLIETILSKNGYAQYEIVIAKATIQIKNWKPLALDQLTDDKQATVGEILGDISTLVTIRIQIFRNSHGNLSTSSKTSSNHQQLTTTTNVNKNATIVQPIVQTNSTDSSNSDSGVETNKSLGQNKSCEIINVIAANDKSITNTNDKSTTTTKTKNNNTNNNYDSFAHPNGFGTLSLSSRTPSVSSVNSLCSLTSGTQLVRTESNPGMYGNIRTRKDKDKTPFLVVFKVSGANAITLWPQCSSQNEDALPPTPHNEHHMKVRRRRREFMSSSICSSTSASEDDERDYQWDIMGSLKSLSSPAAIYYKFRLANLADLPPGTMMQSPAPSLLQLSAGTNQLSDNQTSNISDGSINGGGRGGNGGGGASSSSPSRQSSRSPTPTPTPMKNNLIKEFTLRQPPKDHCGRCEFKPQYSRGKYYNPNDFAMFMSEPLRHVRDATFAVDLTLEQNGDLEDVGTAHLYLNPHCSTQGTQRAPIIKNGVQVGEMVVDFLIIMNPIAYNTNCVMPDWLTKKQLHAGHRGLGSGLVRSSVTTKPGDFLENTIASFNHAAQNHKFDSIELDVFLTLDGIPTIYHDFDVNLVAENGDVERHQVNDFTLDELRKLKLLSLAEKFNNSLELSQLEPENKPFPTLEEVLRNVHPSTGIYVEIKWPQMLEDGTYKARKYREINDFIDKILDVLFKNANGRRIILQSFEPDIVLMMRLKQTQFPVMMLSKGSTDLHGSFLDTRSISVKNGTYYAEAIDIAGIVLIADYYLDLGEDLVKFINEHTLLAHSWGPIDCEENLQYLRRIGVQGFIYDNFHEPEGLIESKDTNQSGTNAIQNGKQQSYQNGHLSSVSTFNGNGQRSNQLINMKNGHHSSSNDQFQMSQHKTWFFNTPQE